MMGCQQLAMRQPQCAQVIDCRYHGVSVAMAAPVLILLWCGLARLGTQVRQVCVGLPKQLVPGMPGPAEQAAADPLTSTGVAAGICLSVVAGVGWLAPSRVG
jgi:hypothetical protein